MQVLIILSQKFMSSASYIEHEFIFISKKYYTVILDFISAIQQAKTEGNSTENDARALQSELKRAEEEQAERLLYKILS